MSSDAHHSQQIATLEALREKMEQARMLYEVAKAVHERVKQDFAEKGLTQQDGIVSHSRETKNILLNIYADAVKRYNSYLLENLRPESRVYTAGNEARAQGAGSSKWQP